MYRPSAPVSNSEMTVESSANEHCQVRLHITLLDALSQYREFIAS